MASKLLLWASVLISAPSVMGLHRLDRLRSSILDMSTDTNAVQVSSAASASTDMGLYSGASTEAALAQRIATQLNQEMFRSLMEMGTEQQVAVDAVYNEKRIGVEVEYQGVPRVVVAVKPDKIAAMKAEFNATGKYAALGAAKWLYASAIPLRYGNSWLVTKKDGQGLPYWKATTDNEYNALTRAEKDFWLPIIARQYEIDYGMAANKAREDAEASMKSYCGLNAAMELVTLPLATTAEYSSEPNYVFVMQAMRVWTQTLRRFTYKSANGGADKGLAEDSMLAQNAPNNDFKTVICKAMGGDTSNFDTVKGKWLGQKNHYIVPVHKVLTEFEATLTEMNGDTKPWKGILNYDFVSSYLENFIWIPKGDFPFTLDGSSDHFYSRYFIFPKLANAAATDSQVKMMKSFRFGPQLNFGFPVSRFGANDSATTISALQTSARNPHNGYYPFTSTIWPWVLLYGQQLYDAVVVANDALHSSRTVWTTEQARDAKGFMTLFLHYYFIEGYLGLRSDKFAHSLLLKAALNDVLRSLHHRSRRYIAAWWDSFPTTNACFLKVDAAAALIYTKSKIGDMEYPIPWAKLAGGKKEERKANARDFIEQVFLSVTTNDASRWKHERARVVNGEGVVTTATRYGKLNVDDQDQTPYPAGRYGLSPVGKRVPPFYITASGIKRPAVLIEHRDGNAISSKFGDVWVDSAAAASPAALKALVDAKINELVAIQTPVLLEQSSQSHGPKVDTNNKGRDFTPKELAAFKSNLVLDDDTLTVKLDEQNKQYQTVEPQKDLAKLLAAAQEKPFAWDNNNQEDKKAQENLKKTAAEITKQCEALLKRQAAKEKLNSGDIEELTETCALK